MIFVINRKDRKERWIHAVREFKRMGIDKPIRFEAVLGGWRGCRDSHLAIMEQNRGKWFYIFEDDVEFVVDDAKRVISDAFAQLPKDWDMLSFGCSPQEPLERYSDNLFKLNKRAWCLHAYILNNQNGIIDFILEHRKLIGKLDVWFSECVYPNFGCYLVYPLVCSQLQYKSDTCARSDVSTIEKNYAKYVTANV